MANHNYTILIAEDAPSTQFLYQEEFEEAGFKVIIAGNGLQVTAELQDEHVDLLITDIQMPDMSALELIPLVNEKYPKLPIIVVSGRYKSLEDDFLARGFKINALFLKPVNMSLIIQKVFDLLGIPNPQA